MSPQPASKASVHKIITGLVIVIAFFAGSATVAFRNIRTLQEATGKVAHTHEVIEGVADVLSLLTDAETGQRGFIITGEDKYLEPYNISINRIDARIGDVQRLTEDNPEQQARAATLKIQADARTRELANVIAIRRADGLEAARARIFTDIGKVAMDELRDHVAVMQQAERVLLKERFAQTEVAFQSAVQSSILSAGLGIALAAIVAWLMWRAANQRQLQQWLQTGQTTLNEKLLGEQRAADLADNALRFLCEYLGAQAGAIFVEDHGGFKRAATYAMPSAGSVPERFAIGEGLLGQAAKDGRPLLVNEVPDGYLTIGSAMGSARPRYLLIAPAQMNGVVNAVVELGFFQGVPEAGTELMARAAPAIGVAVHSANSRTRIEALLEETQRQSEELQAQSEELRVSNEELEEQGRALKESQSQMELQQVELEQTNSQLEEQAQLLEMQRDDLGRSKLRLEEQARVVEAASRYKSNFLANMSHELRTPLNSSLILAKLLADNREGNLLPEQVKFAETIRSSGNDLLALINDVLDLAKVESGHMELRPATIRVEELTGNLRTTFEPIASQRRLALRFEVSPETPESFESDPQRLEQILKNLISNALKFTDVGEVALVITGHPDTRRISFAVRDTGIGISSEQQAIVFEPFCQADGTTSRKYGGTGLGLSISRELSRLLQGEIHLTSEAGRGSTFTLVIPQKLQDAPPPPAPLEAPAGPSASPAAPATKANPAAAAIPDDREHLTGNSRVVLIVEDDQSFAEILTGLAHELHFQCLTATTAEDALAMAQQYSPGAIVLDVGLPDDSGLMVLERLKRDARTRHIPVHVVSAGDYIQPALALGAVGYMLKPVKREELVEVFQKLERRLTQEVRRVLVVEDDAVQLESMKLLLQSGDVEAVGAKTAAECLEKLKSSTFDCMVLDLSLPDASGFSLLETLSQEDRYSFPPVIVYTGRVLSADEEQRLRRYSKSIIVKGAKSPERLLDEVTLFLHQVVSDLPGDKQKMLEKARSREAALDGRHILLVEDDVRNVFALTSFLEPLGVKLQIARNGREALDALDKAVQKSGPPVELILMDIMMPEMDGLSAMQELRKRGEWKKVPVIALTAKAMKTDQEQCLKAGANDYLAKPLDVEKLLSLIRVWMPR